MTMSIEQFARACTDQGISLHNQLTDQDLFLNRCFTPNGLLKGVALAAHLSQRGMRPVVLSDGYLEVTEAMDADPAAQALAHIIQDNRQPRTDTATVSFSHLSQHNIDACATAERRFAKTLLYLDKPEETTEEMGGQIVVGDDNQPILLRKRNNEPSALSLVPLLVAGIRYPAGSIMRLDLHGDELIEGDENLVPAMPAAETSLVDQSRVKAVSFRRLSAFCLAAGQRQDFAIANRHAGSFSRQADEYVRTTPLSEVIATVEAVIQSRVAC